jgi:hypothetical protein
MRNVVRVGQEDISPKVIEVRDKLNTYSLTRLEEMADASTQQMRLHERLRYAKFRLIMPDGGDADTSRILVMNHPHQQRLDMPMYLRGLITQRSFKDGQHPLIQIPQRTLGIKNNGLDMTPRDNKNIKHNGCFLPLAALTARIFEETERVLNGRESTQAVLAEYSLAASIGALLVNRIPTDHALLAEPPNMTARANPGSLSAVKDLMGDFTASSEAKLNKAVTDSGFLPYIESQGVGANGESGLRRKMGLVRFGAAAVLLSQSRAIERGMTYDTFTDDVAYAAAARPETTFAVARAADSALVTVPDFSELEGRIYWQENTGLYEIQGYGHEAGDNVTLLAHLVDKSYDDLKAA